MGRAYGNRTETGEAGSNLATLLCGAAAGAALMYFFDPERGRRRRALLRDKMVGMSNDLSDAAGKTARDLRNRAQGVIAETGGALGLTGGGDRDQSEQRDNARRQAASA